MDDPRVEAVAQARLAANWDLTKMDEKAIAAALEGERPAARRFVAQYDAMQKSVPHG